MPYKLTLKRFSTELYTARRGRKKRTKQRGETEGGALREGATSACIVPGTLIKEESEYSMILRVPSLYGSLTRWETI